MEQKKDSGDVETILPSSPKKVTKQQPSTPMPKKTPSPDLEVPQVKNSINPEGQHASNATGLGRRERGPSSDVMMLKEIRGVSPTGCRRNTGRDTRPRRDARR